MPIIYFRYHLLRYEDLVESPVQAAKALYEFVGVPFKKEYRYK